MVDLVFEAWFHPASRNTAMRVLRTITIACGAVPVRRVDASSLKVVSRPSGSCSRWRPSVRPAGGRGHGRWPCLRLVMQ